MKGALSLAESPRSSKEAGVGAVQAEPGLGLTEVLGPRQHPQVARSWAQTPQFTRGVARPTGLDTGHRCQNIF